MKKFLTHVIFIISIIVLPQFTSTVKACSCLPIPTPYKAYQDAGAVFVGKAVSSNDVAFTEQVNDKTFTAYERHYRFNVEEAFKGAKNLEIDVSAGRVDSSCFVGFTVGETYLVYAYDDSEATLYSHMCTRTRNLVGATADIYYIRALLKGVPEPRLYGVVSRTDNDLSKSKSPVVTPLEGIKIVVEGEGKRFEAVTDKQGLYSIAKMPDGKYKARPELPNKYIIYYPGEEEFILGSQEEEVYPRIRQGDTAYAHFNIGWHNSISGKILDAEGKPLRRAKAAVLVASPDDSPLVIREDEYDYKSDGTYQFYGLTPGRYLLSLKINAPFKSKNKSTLFYYPSAVNLKQARELVVGESDTLSGTDIRLPPGYTVRQIEGALVWPDGSPVASGWVCLTDSELSEEDGQKYDCMTTQGRFSLQGFEGAEYWLHSSVSTLGMKSKSGEDLWESGIQSLIAKPIKVVVGKINEPLRIIIPLPEGVEKPNK